jgi:predicted PurR-regulated permease PerM
VIFVGAIGGFLTTGIIGLFVGAVILVVGYKLFDLWLEDAAAVEGAEGEDSTLERIAQMDGDR